MTTTPSVSIRKWIRWPPDEASEPTLTVVLTSSQRLFVDIRIFYPPSTFASISLPLQQSQSTPVSELSRLDWAFAGRSIRKSTQGTWHHWIDSRTLDPASVRDEGRLAPYQSGDDEGELELELGRMVNPATGLQQDYEELWGDVDLVGERMCIVLQATSRETQEVRGMVVRVSQVCQGIWRGAGDEVRVERWTQAQEGGEWKCLVSIGNAARLPCEKTFSQGWKEEKQLQQEGKFDWEGVAWTVEEVSRW